MALQPRLVHCENGVDSNTTLVRGSALSAAAAAVAFILLADFIFSLLSMDCCIVANGRRALPFVNGDCGTFILFCFVELGCGGKIRPDRLGVDLGGAGAGAEAAAGESPHDSLMEPKLTPALLAPATKLLPTA